jgi:hypothetical protein
MPVFRESAFDPNHRSVNKQGIKRRNSDNIALERFKAETVLINITFRKCLVGCTGKNKGEVSRDQSGEDKKRDQQNNRQLPEHLGLVAEFDNQLVGQHNTGRGPNSRTYFSTSELESYLRTGISESTCGATICGVCGPACLWRNFSTIGSEKSKASFRVTMPSRFASASRLSELNRA